MEGRIQQIYWSKKGSYDGDERTYKIVLLSEDDVKFEDLFEWIYLQTLKEAFNTLRIWEEGEKYGLKVNLNRMFSRSMKVLARYYSKAKLDSKVKESLQF